MHVMHGATSVFYIDYLFLTPLEPHAMLRIAIPMIAAFLAWPTSAFPTSVPTAPPEVISAAPAGGRLIAYATSGEAPNADAVAVFEGSADKAGNRHRTLIAFGKKDGIFKKDFASDKLIACSLCSQFHDDPFRPRHLSVTPGHIYIDQFDSGEKPSSTVIDLERKDGTWRITHVTRDTVVAGREEERKETIPLPSSGLAEDLDALWSVPVFLNTLVVNNHTGQFSFLHRSPTKQAVWETLKERCTSEECTILVQQGDGCMSLVKDEAGRSYGGGSPDPDDEKGAIARAMNACQSAGGNACKEVRTDCSKGI